MFLSCPLLDNDNKMQCWKYVSKLFVKIAIVNGKISRIFQNKHSSKVWVWFLLSYLHLSDYFFYFSQLSLEIFQSKVYKVYNHDTWNG
jgi:hypothetical protein